MPPALVISNISKSYGALQALDRVGFSVPSGSVTALLGPNGAGKTTLFQLLSGLFVADSGTIEVMGINVARNPVGALQQLGIVFQQSTLDLDLSARQNLMFGAQLHGFSRKKAAQQTADSLANFGLTEIAGKPARQLSGGTRRKVELARALMSNPAVLLLDEPSQGLDPQSRKDLVDTVFRSARERRLAVLWATHLVSEVEAADEVIILNKGRIVAQGSPRSLIENTRAPTLEHAFLSLIGPAAEAESTI